MKLIKTLLESIKEHNNFAIEYKGNIYYWDPYDYEKDGMAGKFTEFRCNIGSFGEFLLWNHPDFAPKMENFFKDKDKPTEAEMYKYNEQKVKSMFACEDYEVVMSKDKYK